MSGFRLIGIRPHKDCGAKYLKVLEPGRLYQFYNEYEFYTKDGKFDGVNGEITHYEFKKTVPEDLYNIDGININVCAIVGMNGSGKSTLLDFIYLSSFLIAEEFGILEKLKALDFSSNPEQIVDNSLLTNGNELMNIKNELFYELYYDFGGVVYRLMNSSNEGLTMAYETSGSKNWIHIDYEKTEPSERAKFLGKFFYSISTNYSIYGFNELMSPWIGHLFHKNDGYKTPTVINPYRTNGVININTENHLAQVRTLTSLAASREQFPTIVNEKKIASIEFVLDLFDNNFLSNRNKTDFEFHTVISNSSNPLKFELLELFNKVSSELCGLTISNPEVLRELKQERDNDLKVKAKDKYDIKNYVDLTPSKLKYEFIKYSIRKLYKICVQHFDEFSDYIFQDNSTSPTFIIDLDGLLARLKKDKSHVSLKLRQSLYVCHSNFFESNKWQRIEHYRYPLNKYSYSCIMTWNDLKQKIKKMERQYGKRLDERMEIIPAAFVKPKIFVHNLNKENES